MRREGCAREEVRLPSHPPLYIGERGRRPRGRRPSRLDLPRENPRETCPQAKQVEACLPSQVEAPHLPK